VVPAAPDIRAIWNDAARIESIPRVLVVDRKGVLRLDVSDLPEDFDQQIGSLLEEGE
jgi:hypothetical protein